MFVLDSEETKLVVGGLMAMRKPEGPIGVLREIALNVIKVIARDLGKGPPTMTQF
jgi:hypothetical protein